MEKQSLFVPRPDAINPINPNTFKRQQRHSFKVISGTDALRSDSELGGRAIDKIGELFNKIARKLSYESREHMSKKTFAIPSKKTEDNPAGKGGYPIPDKAHARNALARVSQHGTPAEKAKVRAKVHAKYPDIGKEKKAALNTVLNKMTAKTWTPAQALGAGLGGLGTGAMLHSQLQKEKKAELIFQKLAKDMPHFTDQDRPEKVKEIYRALKREHPNWPAGKKARIAESTYDKMK